MTVCIAASCRDGIIFCASDRMLTAGDIQYEPPSSKTFLLTKFAVSMMSGDAAFYTEIMDAVLAGLEGRHDERVPIVEIAGAFAEQRALALRTRASTAILGPLGLTTETFRIHQRDMDPQLVDKLATELLNFYVPEVDVIIAGIDDRGAQIYVMMEGEISCNNAIGFASVGSGSRHAESQFMLARHSPNAPTAETLFLTYAAKKRSEVAPGVGLVTDLFVITPGDVGVTDIKDDLVQQTKKAYDELQQQEMVNFKAASEKVRQYVETIAPDSERQAETKATVGQPASADGKTANGRKARREEKS
jgi:20S proteasome alpha/beta subunit